MGHLASEAGDIHFYLHGPRDYKYIMIKTVSEFSILQNL